MPTEVESEITFYITLGYVDTISDPTVELIKKELAGATAIRRAVRQGQPNVEALHDQPFTEADPGAFSSGVVSVGGRHSDAATTHDDKNIDSQERINMFENTLFRPYTEHVDIILCLMRKRQLTYWEAYDAADRIMNLDFCKKLKDRYNQLNEEASTLGVGIDFLVPMLVLDEEETLRYGRADRPNLHGKSWTEAKRILAVISMNDMHYWAIEILLEEGKINVYDFNVLLVDDFDLFLLMEPVMVLLPILLMESKLMNHFPKKVLMNKSWDFEGRNRGMILPKDDAANASGSHALAYIECLLTGIEIAKPMNFLCDNAVANL
ncbi:hypothetical protein P3S68_019864 [Capsicum galapagoense]